MQSQPDSQPVEPTCGQCFHPEPMHGTGGCWYCSCAKFRPGVPAPVEPRDERSLDAAPSERQIRAAARAIWEAVPESHSQPTFEAHEAFYDDPNWIGIRWAERTRQSARAAILAYEKERALLAPGALPHKGHLDHAKALRAALAAPKQQVDDECEICGHPTDDEPAIDLRTHDCDEGFTCCDGCTHLGHLFDNLPEGHAALAAAPKDENQ